MNDFIEWILGRNDFPARWTCGHWTPLHGWTHIIADILIWAAYMTIPLILIYFISKRKDLPFPRLFWLFGIFIAACGTTHLVDALIYWEPIYRISAVVKIITAIVSWVTVIALIPIIPYVLSLRSPAELEAEINRRKEAQATLEAANKELDAFSYSISHDLRAPLRAIDGFARLLEEECGQKIDGEGKRLLGILRQNTVTMGHLIDDLLEFSRLGRQEIRSEPVNMEALALNVDEEIRKPENRKISIDIKKLPEASGDIRLLRQVWVNLLSNALKYTKNREFAVIEVGGHSNDKENIYYVKDNGVGFDMQYVNKLFGVFQRLHPAEDFEGTGVGLAIIGRIIKRHGGHVWAEGKVDEGAVFYFTLPRH